MNAKVGGHHDTFRSHRVLVSTLLAAAPVADVIGQQPSADERGVRRTMLEMTSPDFAAAVARSDVMLLPIGAIEQHGPHLPLASDAKRIAAAIPFGFVESRARTVRDRTSHQRREPRPSGVEAFYAAFNSHGWDTAAAFTTDDWEHINPDGGWTRGRDAALTSLRQVHGPFLKGVTETPDSIVVRFALPETAIVTVTSRVSRYVLPNGEVRDDERQIRPFVVVNREGTWLIIHDQNTVRR